MAGGGMSAAAVMDVALLLCLPGVLVVWRVWAAVEWAWGKKKPR